jgi:hypothetical protein
VHSIWRWLTAETCSTKIRTNVHIRKLTIIKSCTCDGLIHIYIYRIHECNRMLKHNIVIIKSGNTFHNVLYKDYKWYHFSRHVMWKRSSEGFFLLQILQPKRVVPSYACSWRGPERAFCVLAFDESKCATDIQRTFRTAYGKEALSRKAIYDWHKKLITTVCLCRRKSSRPSVSEESVQRVRHSEGGRRNHCVEHPWAQNASDDSVEVCP